MRRRWVRSILLAMLLSSGAFLATAVLSQSPIALAHAFVIGSDPVDGSTVNAPPSMVRIFFDAPISPLSVAHIYHIEQGQLVEVGTARSHLATADSRELDTPLATSHTSAQGSYEIKWIAISNADGQTTYGIIGFNVGFSSTGLSGQTILGPSTSNDLQQIRQLNLLDLTSIFWHWVVLIALTLWGGFLVWDQFVLGPQAETFILLKQARKRGLLVQKLCLEALIVGEVVTITLRIMSFLQAPDAYRVNPLFVLQFVGTTAYGQLWLLCVLLSALARVLLGHYMQKQTKQSQQPAKEPVMAVASRSSHEQERELIAEIRDANPTLPSTLTYRSPLIWLGLLGGVTMTYALSTDIINVTSLHMSAFLIGWSTLLAQCIWFGSVAFLGGILLPLLVIEWTDHITALTHVLRQATPLLIRAIGVTLVGTLFLSEASISHIDLLLTDPYGRTLFAQLTLLVLMLVVSFYVLFAPRSKQKQVMRLAVTEQPTQHAASSIVLEQMEHGLRLSTPVFIWMSAGFLLCSALMNFYAPPPIFPPLVNTSSTASSSPIQTNTQTKQIGDLSVTLSVLPGRVSQTNTLVATINDQHGDPVKNAKVSVKINMETMDMGTTQATVPYASPVYTLTFAKQTALTMTGAWDIRLTVQRSGLASVQGVFQIFLVQ